MAVQTQHAVHITGEYTRNWLCKKEFENFNIYDSIVRLCEKYCIGTTKHPDDDDDDIV